MSSIKKVIVFGSTGAVGTHLVTILSKKQPTWEIHAVTRSSSSNKFSELPNVKVIQGDPNKRDEVLKLSADKAIIYACIGFPKYERKYWAKHWPVIVDNLLAGSSQTKNQKLVFCDNLYAYGPNQNISPSTHTVPPSTKSKPAIRAMLREKLQARMEENPDSITVVGGADFFGPPITDTGFLGDTFTKPILSGNAKPIAIGSSDVIHDFCYVPDFSNALYVASISDEAYGRFWICPHSVQGKTMNEIATDIASFGDTQNSKVQVFPGWSLWLLSPFVPFMGEMIEMLPFWKNDYSVDDTDFCKTFHVSATPYEEALKSYIAFYESQQ